MWHCNSCNLDFKERMNTVLKRYLTSETKSLKDICPYCTHLLPNPKTESIDVVKPLLIEEWQSDIYGSISAVFPSSTAKVNWKCRRCQGEFEARICEREENDNCCPYCFGRKVLPGYNSFDVTQPILVQEWDYLNNILLANPSEVSEKSRINVWWTCKNNGEHRYKMSLYNRILFEKRHKEPCLICKGRRRKRQHFVPFKNI